MDRRAPTLSMQAGRSSLSPQIAFGVWRSRERSGRTYLRNRLVALRSGTVSSRFVPRKESQQQDTGSGSQRSAEPDICANHLSAPSEILTLSHKLLTLSLDPSPFEGEGLG